MIGGQISHLSIISMARAGCKSVGSSAKQDMRYGLKHNPNVEIEGPILNVVNIQKAHFLKRQITSSAHLPQPGDTGSDADPRLLPWLIFLEFLRRAGARPDQAHLPAQDVDHLWELVNARPPQKTPGTGHAGIVFDLEQRPISFV